MFCKVDGTPLLFTLMHTHYVRNRLGKYKESEKDICNNYVGTRWKSSFSFVFSTLMEEHVNRNSIFIVDGCANWLGYLVRGMLGKQDPLCRKPLQPLNLEHKKKKNTQSNQTAEKPVGTGVFGTEEIGPMLGCIQWHVWWTVVLFPH